jgi:hypothetical protein
MRCPPKLVWAKTPEGVRYSIDIATRCLICEGSASPKTTHTKDWYCDSCRKDLDDAKELVLNAHRGTPNNRIGHYLSDPVGYQERVEVEEASEWLQRNALMREVQQRRDARV